MADEPCPRYAADIRPMSPVTPRRLLAACTLLTAALVQGASVAAHRPQPLAAGGFRPVNGDRPMRGRQSGGGFGGGFGGGVRADVPLTKQFDTDGNGWLNASERKAARDYAEANGIGRGRGGRGGGGMRAVQVDPGPRLSPRGVRSYDASVDLYDESTLRTLFLEFEDTDWERELTIFKSTDVLVPATLTVDGRRYRDVGVQFHGNSSFSQVPMGLKHSIHLSMDFVHSKQDLGGSSSLTLLNAHEDGTQLRTVLFMHIARDYLPAPRANFVRVVINGESWGIYSNQEQFTRDFTERWFQSREGTRWKIPGSPGNRGGGLAYLGDSVDAYRRFYEVKGKDDPAAWQALIRLTRVLNQTPGPQLETALAPILDVDEALRFLAIDNALVNNDGYWTRGSDYSLYLDPKGRFHVMPYDSNETFAIASGGGFGRGGSPDLDPLYAADDQAKPLASRLLAVPALRTKYLGYQRAIAVKWLDWSRLGPIVTGYQRLIGEDVRTDTHRLDSYEAFQKGADMFREFAARRRAVLLASEAR
jgi:hypothetical protein